MANNVAGCGPSAILVNSIVDPASSCVLIGKRSLVATHARVRTPAELV
jgi:hypothetical protein